MELPTGYQPHPAPRGLLGFCPWFQESKTLGRDVGDTTGTSFSRARHGAEISMTWKRHRVLLYRQLHPAWAPVHGGGRSFWARRPIRGIERGLVLSTGTSGSGLHPVF